MGWEGKMDCETEARLWQGIYALRLRVKALEGILCSFMDTCAEAHERVLFDEMARLPDGPERDGALAAFEAGAFKTKTAEEAFSRMSGTRT